MIHGFTASGIRAFDLRAAYSGHFGRFHTAHALVGVPISYILEAIRQFLDQAKREVVIIQLGTGSSTDDGNWPKLQEMINATFGNRLLPADIDLKGLNKGSDDGNWGKARRRP